jgi:hypothetical protein
MRSCRRRVSIVVPQGFSTEAYAMSAREKGIACSSTAVRHRSDRSSLRAANGEDHDHLSVNDDGRLFAWMIGNSEQGNSC